MWLNFDPQAGKEQAGHRPALVLSPLSYNQLVGLALVCPLTSHRKGYPFEVEVAAKKVSGSALADHIKSVDWKERKATFIERADDQVVDEVLSKISTLLE